MVSNGHEGIFYGLAFILAGILIFAKGPIFVRWEVEWRRRTKQPKWTVAYTEFWAVPSIAIFGTLAVVFGVLVLVAGIAGIDVRLGGAGHSHSPQSLQSHEFDAAHPPNHGAAK